VGGASEGPDCVESVPVSFEAVSAMAAACAAAVSGSAECALFN
jgi:hypothetical protein